MEQKKLYQSPEMEVIQLDTTDIVTASGGDSLADLKSLFDQGGKWGNVLGG